MDVIRLTYPFNETVDADKQVLAIGFFDGVHAGHQEVINRTLNEARRESLKAAVMTFDPHPRVVLGGLNQPHYITPLQEKLNQFAELGLDRCYVLTFNVELSKLSAAGFVEQVLFPLQVDTAVVGFNFTYGNLGRGNVDSLREHGGSRMKVHVIRPFLLDGVKVSSTLIREMIHQGSFDRVRQLLGRPYTITGTVVKGLGRGRTIGVPTANLEASERFVIPDNGVYAVNVTVDGDTVPGVMNIGVKPTFADDPPGRTLEVHLLDYDRIIYDQDVKVEFVQFIRGERKFPSVDALVAQIRLDIDEARKLLRNSFLS